VILIDAGCESACELLALGLGEAAGVTLLGERTSGTSGGPVPVRLPHSGATLKIPTWITYDSQGRVLEGHGVPPDLEVGPTRADLAAESDPVLDRALDLVRRSATP
jgi:carboxyl-terminal processing protease